MPGAYCLQRSLRQSGNACPLVLLLDDRPEVALPPAHSTALRHAYGARNIHSLTALMRRHPQHSKRVRLNGSAESFQDLSSRRRRSRRRRRLYAVTSTYVEFFSLWLKVWLWALEGYRMLLHLDLDLVVTARIDALLGYQFDAEMAAMSCGFHGATDSEAGAFVSNLMLLRPGTPEALRHLGNVMRRTDGTEFRNVPKACEPKQTDQSLLNVEFAGRWHRLPTNLARDARGHPSHPMSHPRAAQLPSQLVNQSEPAMIHFASEPKPWRPLDGSDGGGDRRLVRRVLTKGSDEAQKVALWRSLCAPSKM